ncbi:ShlB/FhaC/HecB family hemolysin secretion/activation protein [Paraburkholderia sp.]|uniref:ShlB/FhaC/HecB family hemolysin secretion/activation protein n=1 Tax=Paraburkholderia sp. TaxID=1926495 RepID=UPI0023837B6D|nr:ShlB/FhaC/HecB family hemolysin secretion/activation protein [Paraburkholderia sp.]MDE1183311.1 ShlB/FhaC/HecB family hemolysin secretion/activation protein [Paraburkholderia sp.]
MTYAGALLASAAGAAHAFEPMDPANHAILDQQQQRLLDQAREQREGLSGQAPAMPAAAPRATDAQTRAALGGDACVPVDSVSFSGAALLPDALKQAVSQDASGRCLDTAALAHLLDTVNDWYVAHGYVTSHAFLPKRDGDSRELTIASVEGRLSRVYFRDGTPRADDAAQMAFGGTAGEPLNLRDVEQGVDQIDRIVPGGVKASVRAAPQQGYSDIVLSGQPVKLFDAAVSVDNSGQKNTGREMLGAAATMNNALGLAEQIGGSVSTTPALHGDRFRRSFNAWATVPYGYWSFSYAGAAGNYAVPLDFYGAKLRYHGSSLQNRFTVTRTVTRNASRKIDVFASVSNYVGKTYLEEFQLQNSSERTSTAQIGVNFATRVGSRSYFTFSPALTQGLPFATHDMSEGGGPSSGFTKLAASASFYTQATQNVALLSSVYAQVAPRTLYSSERVLVGSDTSVRGFRDQYLYGNTGAYLRNEVNWTVPLPASGARMTVMAGVDIGRVVPVEGEPNSGGNVVGAAIGASASWKGVAATVSVGTPLVAPRRLNADPIVLNLKLSSSF